MASPQLLPHLLFLSIFLLCISFVQSQSNSTGCAVYDSCDACDKHLTCVWCSGYCTEGSFYGSKGDWCADWNWGTCKVQGKTLFIIMVAGTGFVLLVTGVCIGCCCCKRKKNNVTNVYYGDDSRASLLPRDTRGQAMRGGYYSPTN